MLEEQEVTLRDYINLVRRRYWIVFATLVIASGMATGISMVRGHVYRASTTLATYKNPPRVLLDRTERAADDIPIFADQAAAQAPDILTLTQLIESDIVREGAVTRLTPIVGLDAAKAIVKGLSALPVADTQLVRISIEYTEPGAAALGANAIAESVIDMNLKARRRQVTETRRFIKEQLALAQEKLQASEAAQVAFKNRHGDVSLAEDTTLKLRRLADLETQRVAVRLPRMEEQSLILGLQRQLAALEVDRYGLRQTFTEKHPQLITTEAKIVETQRRLDAELARSRQADRSREQALTAAINRYEEQLQQVPPREAELARITRNVKEAEQIYLLLSGKLQQTLIAEASIGSSIQVVDVAKVPGAPVSSGARKTIIFGAILGLMLGMGAAVVIDVLDDTVRSIHEVERILDAPVLGAIPLQAPVTNGKSRDRARAAPPVLADLDRPSPEAEAYRTLRTHVLSSIPGVENRALCLLITSALPGEGKSTVAANLALSFVSTDRLVWLLDCDLRRSSLSGLFPEAASEGLAGLLAGKANVDDVALPTHQSGLCFIASGSDVSHPAELLGSQRMSSFIAEARARVDAVLLDSPALLRVTDAEVIASQVDGVLLVVNVGKTDRRALTETRQRLERLRVRVIGAVLNFVPAERRGRYYNTHYNAYYSPRRA
ncbi:MAG: GumC family protein [bacterium]